jgi:glycosyltransferase involved in cell wall biosynthesis
MTVAVLVLLFVVALAWVGLWVSPVHRVTFRDVLDAEPGAATPADAPPVTLVAPARNEAAVLPVTVPTYVAQTYPRLRVVLVDDQSDDDTPRVLADLAARFPGVVVVRTGERPPGWLGKTWAVATGVAAATGAAEATGVRTASIDVAAGPSPSGELYLFTDSDCALHPDAVATAVRFLLSRDLDLLSVLPRMEFGPYCEKIGLPGLVTVLGMMFPLGVVNNPASPLALAAGGFILVRRGAYDRIGGHAAVRHHVVEDVNLAKLAKASGVRTHTRLTRNLVTTHMYDGWADLWEGLCKNAYAGMDYDPKKFWVGLVVGVVVMVLPPVYLAATLGWAAAATSAAAGSAGAGGAASAWVAVCLAAVGVIAQAAIHARTVRHMGLPVYHAVLMPLSVGLYLAAAVASAFRHHYRGGNVWKGRRYGREEAA